MPPTFAPALIIGLGGSGVDIARRFKRRLLDTSGETPYIRFLGIDTATQTTHTAEVPQLSADEFIHAANFNSDYYVGANSIDSHPAIRAWWQGYHLPTKMIQQGAGMRRPFGRLALYVHFDKVKDRLTSHLRAIFNNSVFGDLQPHYKRVINVYIASSTCGGTGTGMFLDMAYLTNALVPQVQPNVTTYTRSILLMPSAFTGTNAFDGASTRSLQANALGALSELDGCMCRKSVLPDLRYPSGPPVPRLSRPFKSCFLLGNQTADGAVVTDLPTLLERAATQMQIDLASQLDEYGRSRMDNILEDIAALPDSRGKPRLYSSFSNDWLELPSRRIAVRWTKLLAGRLLDRLGGVAGRNVSELLGQASAFKRCGELLEGRGLSAYLPKVSGEIDGFMEIGTQAKDPGQLLQRAHELQSAAQRQIDQNAALPSLIEDNLSKVAEEISALAGDILATGGLADVRAIVGEVLDDLERWSDAARTSAAQHGAPAWVSAFADAISMCRKGLLEKPDAFAQRQRELVIDALEQARAEWQRSLRSQVAGRALDILPSVSAKLRQLRERIDGARAVIGAAASVIEGQPEPGLPPGSAGGTVSDAQIAAAFADAARLERMELKVGPHLKALLGGAGLTAEDLAQRILEAAHDAVRVVVREYLGSLDIPAETVAQRLERLSPLAVFRQDFQATQDYSEVRKLWLVGLPESSTGKKEGVKGFLSPEVRQITDFVALTDENRVVMTVQHHGFPLFGLAEMSECARSFQESSSVDRVLRYVFPDAELRKWGILPLEAGQAKRWFAVALAVGSIAKRGTSYFYNDNGVSSDPNDVDNLLLASNDDKNAARQQARDSFLGAGFAAEVEMVCQARMHQEGNSPLCDQLGKWVQSQEEKAGQADYPAEYRYDVEQVKVYLQAIRE